MGYCIFLRKGKTHTVPIAGTKASDLAIGSIVKLNENGVYTDFIVVNQGIPENSSLYDSSCDGTWLLRKDIKENRPWNSSTDNAYETSATSTWLNTDYFDVLGSVEQRVIKQVRIPYLSGGGRGGTIMTGENGLFAKIFLIGGYEVGWTTSEDGSIPRDGAKLDYFTSGDSGSDKRVAYLNSDTVSWWLRSPYIGNSNGTWNVTSSGARTASNVSYSYGIRPALIIPSTAKFDTDMKLIG